MKQTKKLIVMTLTVVALMCCFITGVSAAKITVGLLSEVRATQTYSSITLSWDKAENAKGYRIFKRVNGKWKAIKTTTAKKYTVTNLEEKTSYTFAVRPYTKVNGEVIWAKKYAKVDTHTTGFVANLTKVNVKQNNNSITLSWEKAQGARGYRIFENINGKWKALKTTTAVKYTINELDYGTKHTYAVRPYTKFNGNTVWAKTYAKASVTVKPAQVTGLTYTATKNSANLYWDSIGDNEDIKYAIFSYNATTGKYTLIQKTPNTFCTISGLKQGTTYRYAVQAYITINKTEYWGKVSPVITVTTKKSTDNSVGTTDVGIKLYPVTSKEAKQIITSFPEFEDLPGYESKSADGKTILVYTKSEDGWYGRSITGALYDTYGKPMFCEYCNKTYGSGTNMCFGECIKIFS